MIKAGEAGGALETILQRLAEFQERSQSLKRKVRGALVYPVCVVTFAVLILVFIMLKIVPAFIKIFKDFDTELPDHPSADFRLGLRGELLVPDTRRSAVDLVADQTDTKVRPGTLRVGPVHAQDADLRSTGGKEHRGAVARGPWARWWPAACRSSRPCKSRATPRAMPCSSTFTGRSTKRFARANRSPRR